jgi:hypothetical protein
LLQSEERERSTPRQEDTSMAWNDYDRTDYRGYGYRGEGWGSRGGWGSGYGENRGSRPGGWSGGSRDDAGRGGWFGGGRYGAEYGGRAGYGYDYEVRRPPEQSPLYGRNADQEVQRWARRYGYDVEFEIQPHERGGRMGRMEGSRRGYGGSTNWSGYGEAGGHRRSGSRYGNTGWGGRDSGDWW